MRRAWRWVAATAASVAFLLGCLSFVSAYFVYEEAGRWFARATYNAQCPSVTSLGCQELSRQLPRWPSGIEVTDKEVLLAEAGALHNTGSGVLTLGGLFMATAGVLGAAITSGRSAMEAIERGPGPRQLRR